MISNAALFYPLFLFATLFTVPGFAKVWNVGPARTYTLPSQVASLVASGDIVEIDSAVYTDCANWNVDNLTLKGVGGRPKIIDKVCAGKGIWNLNGINTLIENIEFSGATNIDQNGAGIRGSRGGFTVRHCYFHHNDNGILAFPYGTLSSDQSNVLIEFCEFSENGFGDGQSHNMYIGDFAQFTLQYCYVHSAKVGHEVKSRAHNNYILYNRISDETSTASRNLDIPNGGNCIVIGNVIEQGPNTQNSNMVGYGLEGLSNPAPHQLILVHNTLVNNRSAGNFISVQTGTQLLKVMNTIFAGNGTIVVGTPALLDSARNLVRPSIASVGFQDANSYNYQLTAFSPALNRAGSPGMSGNFSLSAESEYVHPAGKRDRVADGLPDIGSYEYHTTPTSLSDERIKSRFAQAFPNPFESTFTLHMTKAVEKVTISDLQGRELSQIGQVADGASIEIGEELGKGTYLLSVRFASGEWETTRLVKVK